MGGSIHDISVSGVECTDPFTGLATGDSVAGCPIHQAIAIEKQDVSVGHIGRVDISDLRLDGAARMAVSLGKEVAGPITLDRCSFTNYAAAIFSWIDKGSVVAYSPIILRDLTAVPSPNAPANTRGVMPDAHRNKQIPYIGEVMRCAVPTVTAGSPATFPILRAGRDSWISRVEVMAVESITPDDGNFIRITLRNGATGAILASASTSSDGLNIQSGVASSINGSEQMSGEPPCLPKDGELLVEISHEGRGATLTEPTFVVHFVPYGVS